MTIKSSAKRYVGCAGTFPNYIFIKVDEYTWYIPFSKVFINILNYLNIIHVLCLISVIKKIGTCFRFFIFYSIMLVTECIHLFIYKCPYTIKRTNRPVFCKAMPCIKRKIIAELPSLSSITYLFGDPDASKLDKRRIPNHGRIFYWHLYSVSLKLNTEVKKQFIFFYSCGKIISQKIFTCFIGIQ